MAEFSALRLFRAVRSPICTLPRSALRAPVAVAALRPFSQTALKSKDGGEIMDTLKKVDPIFNRQSALGSVIPETSEVDMTFKNLAKQEWEEVERHHLHVYAHKHNTHITLTKPNFDPLISVSCGNIGFRKAGRGTYDSAYQLAAFVMSRIKDKGLLPQIEKIEIIYRGFGPGREAVTKALLGSEGKTIRPLVCRLSDCTRLKFGGTRSKKPRRLG